MKRYFRELSVFTALGILLLILAIAAPGFFQVQPLVSLLTREAPVLVVALGVAFVIISRQIDISVGSQFAVCSVCAGMLASQHWPIPLVALASILIGGFLGSINGLLIAGLNLPSIVVTLATMVTWREGLRWLRQGQFVNLPDALQWFGLSQTAGQALIMITAFALFLAITVASKHLTAARFVYAVGSNAEAARLAGIRPRLVTFSVFVFTGALTGLAAMLNIVQSPQVDPKSGTGLELKTIAAAVVGGIAISGGRGNLVGMFAGLLLLACISPALVHLRIEPYWERAIQGAIILLAVVADGFRNRKLSLADMPAQNSHPKIALWKVLWIRHETILLLIVVFEWLYFNSIGPRFGTLDNSFDIIRHTVEIGLLALVMTPIILTGGIDLSVGSLLGLSAIIFGKLWRDLGLSPINAALCTLIAGALAGGLNASLITMLRLPPLIVTLGTYSLFRGLAEGVTHGVDTFTNFPSAFLAFGQERFLGLPAQTPIFLIVAIVIWILVHRTTFGRSFRAIGFSSEGARYAGIPVERRLALVYILAGLVAAMAAIIYTARLGQAKADAGTGYELFAITAVVLGGTSIFGGVGSVHGTLLGVAAIAILNNGLVHARQPRELAGMLTGALLIVALSASSAPKLFSVLRGRRHNRAEPIQKTKSA